MWNHCSLSQIYQCSHVICWAFSPSPKSYDIVAEGIRFLTTFPNRAGTLLPRTFGPNIRNPRTENLVGQTNYSIIVLSYCHSHLLLLRFAHFRLLTTKVRGNFLLFFFGNFFGFFHGNFLNQGLIALQPGAGMLPVFQT